VRAVSILWLLALITRLKKRVSPVLYRDTIVKGSHGELVLGKLLAEHLGAAIGDNVSILVQHPDGYLDALDLEVSGWIDFPADDVSRRIAYIDIRVLQEFFGIGPKMSVLAMRGEKTGLLKLKVPDGFEMREFEVLFPAIERVRKVWQHAMLFMVSLLLVLAMVSHP
jgi:ABC-type lipoprotein release transport system permease subunit